MPYVITDDIVRKYRFNRPMLLKMRPKVSKKLKREIDEYLRLLELDKAIDRAMARKIT